MLADKTFKEIYEEINKYQKNIEIYLKEIKKAPNNYIKKQLYNNILDLDNTKEEYVLDYLLCIQSMVKKNEYKLDDFEKEFKKYELCLSEANYQTYFKKFKRTNARQKFFEYFDYFKSCSSYTYEEKITLISKCNYFLLKLNVSYNNTKKVTWQNEELYLNYLFKFLVNSICNLIAYFNMNSNLLKDEEYEKMNKELEKEIPKNSSFSSLICLKNKKIIFFLTKAKFFDYVDMIKTFLQNVDQSFNEKFNNLELKDINDRELFEDYINFLATYKFDSLEYVPFWIESFTPLNLETKKEIIYNIISHKLDVNNIKFELSEDGTKLEIKDNKTNHVIDIDKYVLSKIKNESKYEFVDSIKWKLNKYLKPNYYKEELFVCKTREHWKKLLIEIFRSQTYKEAKDLIFTQTQIDFFMIDDIISEIIDNLKFFIYNTSFLGNTNKERTCIYEYGNYNVGIKNKSVSLLIFYGFHVIINLHEISGHLYIKYQYYFSLNEKNCSPELNSNYYDLYSLSAIKRKKESGEDLEINLFGKIRSELTIKEAIFILNKDNYALSLSKFKEKFLECNKESFETLIDNNLKRFLSNLGIDYSELDENDPTVYNYPVDRRVDALKHYKLKDNKSRHPLFFYYDDPNFIKDYFLSIFNENVESN